MTLAARLALALADAPGYLPDDVCDHAPLLTGDLPDSATPAPPVPAAVLIAITDRPEPGVLLTRRTDTLRHHAGQVAFPGGRIDPDDADATRAALREAHEEIGLDPDRVAIVGIANRYRTITGYEITPVVGVVPPDLTLIAAVDEVAEVFEVPLLFLLDPANQHRRSRDWQGVERHYYEIEWQGRHVWGATAAMIVNLSRRLRWR